MKVLEVTEISKQFNGVRAVDNLSFDIEEGALFGLLGPNGAGKTTTIRMILHIIIPDKGSIKALGAESTKLVSDAIGYLPEERGMYRKMKVEQLLYFLADLKSMKKKDAKKQIEYWLEKFEMQDWGKKKVEELSKGMQQKIQFIGTILHKPRILILDEPFGGLDPINTNLIKDTMLELRENGTTIIFSTHIMESAEKLCEEILLINKGRTVLSGKLAEIKNQFGKRNVLIEFEGDDSFLSKSKHIKKYDFFGNGAEIQLTEDADTQSLLREAMESARIRKFELQEPSLNDIFIESVGLDKKEEVEHE